jgi:branched-chain amino acid transport system permease protein
LSTDVVILLQSILNGILFGSLFGILAMGLTLTWGLLKVANFAHLSFALFAAYLSYTLIVVHGWDPLATLFPIIPILFLIGMAVQWLFERFRVTTFTSLLLTFGMFIVIENVITLVWKADTLSSRREIAEIYRQAIRLPPPFEKLLVLPPDLMAFIAAAVLGSVIVVVLNYTQWGRAVRAMSQDAAIAQAFGVHYRREALILSGLATATAGIAGMLIAVKMPIYPSLPITWIGKVIAAVIIGGIGNPIGAWIAVCSLSVVENIWSIENPPSFAPMISFILLLVMLVFQPQLVLRRWRDRQRLNRG